MRVLACYVNRHPIAAEALDKFAPQAERVYTPGEYGYWQAIADRWTGEDDLVIIEQDNEITADVLPSFAACPEPWCTYAYPIGLYDYNTALGCAKFSADCQRIFPVNWISQVPVFWGVVDAAIALCLMHGRLRPHVHGRLNHYHEYTLWWIDKENGKYGMKSHTDSPPEGADVFYTLNGSIIERRADD